MIPPSSSIRSSNTPAFQPIHPGKRQAIGLGQTLAGSFPIRFKGGEDKPLSLLETAKTIYSHFKKQENPQVIKAFTMKYGTDLAFPALFAIPVVGWAAGILAIPFAWVFNKKGEKQLKDFAKDDKFKNHPAIRAEKIANHWTEDATSVDGLVERYNKFIESLFPTHDDAGKPLTDNANNIKLRKKLGLTKEAQNSKGYKFVQQLVDAKNALRKSIFRHITAPFDGIHWILKQIHLPSAIRRVFLLPKLLMLGVFFFLKRKPKVV